MNSSATTATEVVPIAKFDVPVLRIEPPDRLWILPLAEIWDYRELIYFFVWRELKIRYKQTAIGAGLGGAPAALDDGGLQPLLWQARSYSLEWLALSHFLSRRCFLGRISPLRCKTPRTR